VVYSPWLPPSRVREPVYVLPAGNNDLIYHSKSTPV
jgi:hypothetical protein